MAKSDKATVEGVLTDIIFRKDDFVIAAIEDGTIVKGSAPEGELQVGLKYEFFGKWKHNEQYGRTELVFDLFGVRDPHSRAGVVTYLAKYAPHVGPVIAGRLYDTFEGDAVVVLRTDPARASAAVKLSLADALEASAELNRIVMFESTKIELTTLFHGRGFSGKTIEEAIAKWKLHAPNVIKKNPFALLVAGIAGAGFLRCDRLYTDLGYSKNRLKRQMLCIWYALREDTSGDTWLDFKEVTKKLLGAVDEDEINPLRAVKLGLRARWLAVYKDERGKVWLAEKKKADDEFFLAKKLRLLQTPMLPSTEKSSAPTPEATTT